MLNKIISLFVFVLTFAILGCAGTNKPEVIYNYYPGLEVRERIIQANNLFKNGEYRAASKIYLELLEEYSSSDQRFETAVTTNLCLTYLELGERKNFKACAETLREVSKNLPYLSRETQLVLELNNLLGNNSKTEDDLRINSRITDGLTEVFKEVE